MKLTNSQEEYLKAIYLLSNTKSEVRVTDIANALDITKPSVNKAIKLLDQIGLINYEIYGSVSLTEDGKNNAKSILKKYDIVNIFLKEILKVDEEIAKDDAANIKSVISEETLEKLEEYIVKTLDITSLKCGCNIDNEKCRKCTRLLKANEGGKN